MPPEGQNISNILYHVKHGMEIPCPVCCSPGRLDLSLDKEPAFEHSIWYNVECDRWECWDCWLK